MGSIELFENANLYAWVLPAAEVCDVSFGRMTLLQQYDPRDPMRMAIRQVVCVCSPN